MLQKKASCEFPWLSSDSKASPRVAFQDLAIMFLHCPALGALCELRARPRAKCRPGPIRFGRNILFWKKQSPFRRVTHQSPTHPFSEPKQLAVTKQDLRAKANSKTAPEGSFGISTPSFTRWCSVIEQLPKKVTSDANADVGLRFAPEPNKTGHP
jgi:hypothetical protein